ncbi:MFS transporter [Leucobacter sp. UCMA 4100]|uniref:MFS transporter n=1 Tax=Leucobacter sp. UCMA 4100 TaxID=2810534 RepID=UPI0022EB5636|nr:MFS transporter [Leucobacter sp. UCMA 4100]MDA3146616.1 MFS transporter [Leucobacter sp. UCMA 4100]
MVVGDRASWWALFAHAVLVQALSYGLRSSVSYEFLGLGLGGSWLGYSAAAFALPPLLLAIPSGVLVRRCGERFVLVVGALFFLLSVLLLGVGRDQALVLLLASSLIGCGVLFSVVAEQAWVMKKAAKHRLDFTFGMYTFATSGGQMLGPLMLMLPAYAAFEHGVFAEARSLGGVSLVLSLLLVAFSAVIRSEKTQVNAQVNAHGDPASVTRSTGLLRQRGIISALFVSSVVLTSLDLVIVYVPLLADELGLPVAAASALLVVRGAVTMLSRLLLSVFTARVGRRAALMIGCLFAGVGLACFAVVPVVWLLMIAIAVYGLAAGVVQPLTMSWMTLVTTPEQRPVAAALRLVGNRVGQTTLPLAASFLAGFGGATMVFALMATLLTCSAVTARQAPNDR